MSLAVRSATGNVTAGSTGGALSVTTPSTTAVGDVIVLLMERTDSLASQKPATGAWTSRGSSIVTDSATYAINLEVLTLTVTVAGAMTITHPDASSSDKAMTAIVVSGGAVETPNGGVQTFQNAAAAVGPYSAPAVTTTAAGCLLFHAYAVGGAGGSAGVGMTPNAVDTSDYAASDSYLGLAVGHRALSSVGTQAATSSSSTTGSGQLASMSFAIAPTATAATGTAALSGGGVLTAGGAPTTTGVATLAGAGTLATAAKSSLTAVAALTGTGALASSGVPAIATAVMLGGSGALSTSQSGRPSVNATAALSGAGVISTGTSTATTGTAALSGAGNMAIIGAPAAGAAAALDGAGTLTTNGSAATAGTADMLGRGVLRTAGATGNSATASMSGGGVLTTTATSSTAGAAALSGGGNLIAGGGARVAATASLAGSGQLGASSQSQFRAIATLTGAGALATGGASSSMSGSASTAGSGSLTTTATGLATVGAADLSGAGWLSALAQLSTLGVAALSGNGVLTVTGATVLPPRDITTTVATGADRWNTTTGVDRWVVTTGGTMADQTIDVTAGAVEYCYPRMITAQPKADGQPVDLREDVVLVSLGSALTPGDWVAPDIIDRPDNSTVIVQLLISADDAPPGVYWLWVKVADSSETVPRRTPGRIRIV